jgi:preprotein translocase subunit SecF
MRSMTQLGNDLYSGKTSFPFVQRRRLWFIIAAVLVIGAALVPLFRPVAFSIEFTGGSQFTVSNPASFDQAIATEAVASVVPDAATRVTTISDQAVRVQTDQLDDQQTQSVSTALAEGYGVPSSEITNSFIGPTWGEDVTRQSLWGLGIFLALTFVILALYFRTWKMSVAAIIGLYDTTVVFDKVRENTREDGEISGRTFAESVNLAANQTLIRSINTTVVAILPVGAILFIGVPLGARTLSDISLSIFVGTIVAAYSTLFVAVPLYALLRERETPIKERDARVLAARAKAGVPA